MSQKEFVELFERFIASRTTPSEESLATMRRSLREFVRWYVRDRRFRFRPRDVERYRRHLVQRKGLKPNTVANYVSALRSFFEYLVEKKHLVENPAVGVAPSRRHSTHKRPPLEPADITRLLSLTEGDTLSNARDRAMISLMLEHGITTTLLVALNVGSLRRSKNHYVLRLPRSNRRGPHTGSKWFRLQLTDASHAALDSYLDRRFADTARDREAPLFVSHANRNRNQRLSARRSREIVDGYLRRAKLKTVGPSDLSVQSLRHTAIARAVAAGCDAEELMRRFQLGTRHTAELYIRQLRDAE